MIKPRYIKSLTFLLLCNMALWDRKRFLLLVWFWSFFVCWFVSKLVQTETVRKKRGIRTEWNETGQRDEWRLLLCQSVWWRREKTSVAEAAHLFSSSSSLLFSVVTSSSADVTGGSGGGWGWVICCGWQWTLISRRLLAHFPTHLVKIHQSNRKRSTYTGSHPSFSLFF